MYIVGTLVWYLLHCKLMGVAKNFSLYRAKTVLFKKKNQKFMRLAVVVLIRITTVFPRHLSKFGLVFEL